MGSSILFSFGSLFALDIGIIPPPLLCMKFISLCFKLINHLWIKSFLSVKVAASLLWPLLFLAGSIDYVSVIVFFVLFTGFSK